MFTALTLSPPPMILIQERLADWLSKVFSGPAKRPLLKKESEEDGTIPYRIYTPVKTDEAQSKVKEQKNKEARP